SGAFELGGDLPVNTDGGLKTFGHPTGATGVRMIYENYKQLQGKARKRQGKNATVGLSHNIGGPPPAGGICIVPTPRRPRARGGGVGGGGGGGGGTGGGEGAAAGGRLQLPAHAARLGARLRGRRMAVRISRRREARDRRRLPARAPRHEGRARAARVGHGAPHA